MIIISWLTIPRVMSLAVELWIYSEMILEREKQGISAEELRLLINQHHDYSVADVEHNIIGAGQVVGLLHDVPTVSEIIESIIYEAGIIVKRLGGLI